MFIDNSTQVGQSFYFRSLGPGYSGGTNINQIIAPASNTTGIIIRTLTISAQFVSPSTASASYVYADTAAPASVEDYTKRCIFHVLSRAAGSISPQMLTATHPYPLLIPSGMGIWVTTQALGSGDQSDCTLAMTWDPVSA